MITLGLDPHPSSHTVAALDVNGSSLANLTVPNTPAGLFGSLPGFSMGDNNKARLGFGLESDDTGSTSQQQWVFYSGGTEQNLRAGFGSGIPHGARDRQIRGFLDVCCNKDGNFWEAPPAHDTYDWIRVKK